MNVLLRSIALPFLKTRLNPPRLAIRRVRLRGLAARLAGDRVALPGDHFRHDGRQCQPKAAFNADVFNENCVARLFLSVRLDNEGLGEFQHLRQRAHRGGLRGKHVRQAVHRPNGAVENVA